MNYTEEQFKEVSEVLEEMGRTGTHDMKPKVSRPFLTVFFVADGRGDEVVRTLFGCQEWPRHRDGRPLDGFALDG